MQGICGANVEVDLSNAAAFAAAIRAQIDGAKRRTVFVDCASVTFMDSCAVAVLLDAHHYALRRGHRLAVGNLRRNCERVIRLCDQQHELAIESPPSLVQVTTPDDHRTHATSPAAASR